MQSTLVISSDRIQRTNYIQKACERLQIHQFDQTNIISEKSVGIDKIRELQKKIYLKPLKGRNKAIIINQAHTMTIESQNALLKSLEEPPPQTYIFLSASQLEVFLPTILSRCTLVSLIPETDTFNLESINNMQQEWISLGNSSLNERLVKSQEVSKDKEELLQWIVLSIHANRKSMFEQVEHTEGLHIILHRLFQLLTCYQVLKTTNINIRFLMENLFLSVE